MTTINPYLTFNGTCEQAFNVGIHWMVNCELQEHKDYEAKNRKDS
ncbi:MAG: hypothetical protein Q8M08_01755 [Bacteroidales bacterium]|nr:hypothetical protein [Bacteroidales bacterium]